MSQANRYPLRPALKNPYQRRAAEKRREKLRATGGGKETRRRWVQFDLTEVGSAFSRPNHGRQRSMSDSTLAEHRDRERAWKIKRQKIYDAIDERHGFSHPRPSMVPGSPRCRDWSTDRDRRLESGPYRDRENDISSRMDDLSISGRSDQRTSRRRSRSAGRRFDDRTNASTVSGDSANRRTKTHMSSIEKWIKRVGDVL